MYGRYALEWEQAELDRLVGDVFGYHALQIGLPDLEGLRANRMPSRWLLLPGDAGLEVPGPGDREVPPQPDMVGVGRLRADVHALPFPAASLDLVVMPHVLETAVDPHQTLREAERVLRPEGRLVITGFNPASLWGVSRRLERLRTRPSGGPASLSTSGDWVGYWRLRDWLRLLSFEIEGGRFGCYIPPVTTPRWRDRTAWLEPVGDRWWPVLGSVYALMAVKRVRGMRLVGLSRRQRVRTATAPTVATRSQSRDA